MRNLFIFCVCLFISISSFAQDAIVKGKVSGNDKIGIPGVNVIVKGTTNGTITDIDGNYTLKVNSGLSLVFSCIGYESREVVFTGKSPINVTLEEKVQKVKEVVVTALGIKREKKSLGYTMQGVTSEDLNKSKDPNILNSLNARVAGVQITAGNSGVGSSSRMIIRGENSLANDNQPLFVIDGVPINNYTAPSVTTSEGSGAQEVDYGNGAGEVNPDDIESISILKGANAAALYGSRAANGVILITTKSGKNGQKGIGVSVNSTITFEDMLVIPSFQNEFGQGSKGEFSFMDGIGAGTNDGVDESWGPAFSAFDKLPQFDSPSVDANGNPVRAGDIVSRITGYTADGKPVYTSITPTDWKAYPNNVEDFFRTGITKSNNVALSGNYEEGNFRVSYTNLDSRGIIPNVNLKRNTASLNANYNLSSDLSVKTFASYIGSESANRPGSGYGPENPMYLFAWYGRNLNTESFKDYWQPGMENVQQFTYNIWHENPYFNMYENTNGFSKNRMIGNVVVNWQITPDLSLMGRSGIDWFQDNRVSKRAYSSKRFVKGMYRETDVFFKEQNHDFLLTYNKTIGTSIQATVSAGGNQMIQENSFTSTIANELAIPGVFSLNNTAVPLETTQYDTEKRINSLYGMVQLNFEDKIFLDITARNDWSSTLPKENNSYFYPSVSLSGIVSDMLELPEVITFAKIRAGYAEVGNDTDPYRLRSVYKYTTPYGSAYGLSDDDIIPSADLKPEKQTSFEVGAEVALFKGRVSFDMTWYRNNNSNQIIKLPIATSSGYSSRFVNAGEIQNTGIEALLSFTPVKTRDLKWDVALNFSKNKGIVKSITEGMEEYIYKWTTPYDNDAAKVYAIAKVGDELGNFYGTGFKQVEVDGKMRTIYENGIPVQDPDIRKLGNYNPDFILGIVNSINYKGFRLSAVFDWRQGGEVVSRFYSIASRTGVLDHTVLGRSNGADGVIGDGVCWNAATGSYQENDVKVTSQTYHKAVYRRVNEESALFDASFVKFRELSLGYTFPKKMLKNLPIKDLSVSLVGRNLALWTEQDYFDPETGSYENESYMPGVEEFAYPSTRSIGFNVSFKF